MEQMSDLISKQAAIDALHTWFRDGFDEDKWWNSTHVLAAIEGLPPAQPEHTGKWFYQNGMIKCDQCLRAIRRIDHDGLLNFCPNCGADMREVTT